MKKILFTIISSVLFLSQSFAGLTNDYRKDCSENGRCVEKVNGCTKIHGIDNLNCISQYSFSNNHIMGISPSSIYFIIDDSTQNLQIFKDRASWANYLKVNNIGPLPTQNPSTSKSKVKALLRKNKASSMLKNVLTCFELNGYLTGEAVNNEYFIFNENTLQLEVFTNRSKWENQLAEKQINVSKVSWQSGLLEKSQNILNLLIDLNPIALGAILSLLVMNILFLAQLFSNFFYRPYRRFGVSFVAFEVLLLVYFMTF